MRKLQLDLIWIGTLYKLGTDVKKFNAYMNENENFEVVDVEFWNGFLECLDKGLLNK